MLSKLIRTIIGLPFVLVAWLPCLIIMGIFWAIGHTVLLWGWVATGEYKLLEGKDAERFNNEVLIAVTLPYQFLKKVWR